MSDEWYNMNNLSFGGQNPKKKQKSNVGKQKLSKPDIDFNTQLSKIREARNNGKLSDAYDLADELLRFMDERPHFFTSGHRNTVWNRIYEMLEEQYRDAIIEKYKDLYREIKMFGSYENYRVSHYPKSYDEYCKSAALSELMSLYAGTRYGGYMHVITMKVLREYFEHEKEPGLPENVSKKNDEYLEH